MKSKIFGKITTQVSLLSTLAILTSCAGMFEYRPYARNVKKKPGKSGVIALEINHRAEDRTLATSMMNENCGNKKAVVTDEGEVVIGTVTNSTKKSTEGGETNYGNFFGLPVSSSSPDTESTSSTTTQKKEWQINYHCA